MAVLATMAMLAATGTALAGGGVEIQLTQERPTAGGTGVLVAQRTLTNDLARIQSSEIDQRPDPGSGGSGGTTPTLIRPMDQTQADGGWVCHVLQSAIGQYVDLSVVCN